MDLLKCLTSSGNISKTALFINLIKTIPSIYSYEFNKKEIDLEKIDTDILKKIFPNFLYTWNCKTQIESNTSEELDNEIFIDEKYVDVAINIIHNNILWTILPSSIMCLYDCTFISLDVLKNKMISILNNLPIKVNKPKESEVNLVAFDGRDYYTITSNVNNTNIDLQKNYNDDFISVHQDIVKFLNQRESGLIILNGVAGTGKSFYIRYLLSQFPNEYIIVTNTMAAHLAQPEFISFMLEHKNSIFILEDCEQILMDRAENTFGNAITNILNMSDGLMSDIFNVKFICTFNADINKIDSALLRKGRCYARYEFGPLKIDKVKQFIKDHHINIDSNNVKEMTLGDLYNIDVSDEYKSNITNTRKKIGF